MNDLDVFCFTSVARTKSFSITARELLISQQAVSKHIKNLEDELGHQLIFRDVSPLALTQAGVLMLEYFSKREKIKAELISTFATTEQSHDFTLACSQWTGCPDWFSDTVGEFLRIHPEVDLHLLNLDADEVIKEVSENSLDFLLTSRYMTRHLPDLWKYTCLSSQSLYLIRNRNIPEDIRLLHQYPLFVSSAGESNDNAIRMRVRNTCSKLGFHPQNIICCHDMGSVIFNVLLNDGLTLGAYADDQVDAREYAFDKTDLMVDIVTCMPYHTTNPYAEEFQKMLNSRFSRQIGEGSHE